MIAIIVGTLGFVTLAASMLVVQVGFIIAFSIFIIGFGVIITGVVGFVMFVRRVAHLPRGGFG